MEVWYRLWIFFHYSWLSIWFKAIFILALYQTNLSEIKFQWICLKIFILDNRLNEIWKRKETKMYKLNERWENHVQFVICLLLQQLYHLTSSMIEIRIVQSDWILSNLYLLVKDNWFIYDPKKLVIFVQILHMIRGSEL
jgi:hypothetical protein